MATKEVKELSIESIKKELIDKFVNNMDILRYLEVERHNDVNIPKCRILSFMIMINQM